MCILEGHVPILSVPGKGKKRLRDIPVLHDEKKTRHNLLITPSSWKKLQRIAQKNGLSLSEYVEQWIISLEEGR